MPHLSPSEISQRVHAASPRAFWSDRSDSPEPAPSLTESISADLAIIGGGFTGLWAALQAVTENPSRDIVVIEQERCGFGASSRNGGFCEASLTHGLLNGLSHWPKEISTLERMGNDNLAEIIATCKQLGIDAEIEPTGQLEVAVTPWQVEDLKETQQIAADHGAALEFLDEAAVRREVDSPTYLAGLWDRSGAAMVHPARLVWGLRQACIDAGVKIYEQSRVASINPVGNELVVSTNAGTCRAHKTIISTNAYAEPDRSVRRYVIPIYDHVLMTEPLTTEQKTSIGWDNRQGMADSGYQFHYFRLTADDRILWGGYDANYYKGNGIGPQYEDRINSHITIAEHFYDMFPQLEDVGFSHRWAGPIGTTSKFTAAFGTKHGGNLAWVGGYTGLGVGASRWGARVALDLVDGLDTERTELQMVRRKPVPFPPEPLRNPIIQFTRGRIAKADANNGEPGLWLRFLDAFGVGFDS